MNNQKPSYAGMTVNERLFTSGLMKEFDEAKKKKDKKELIRILKSIDLSESSIENILKDI